METKINRQSLLIAILLLYLIPLSLFIFYSFGLMSKDDSWSILSLGLLIASVGSLGLFIFIYYWEQAFLYYLKHESELVNTKTQIDSKVTAIHPSHQVNEQAKDSLVENKEDLKDLVGLQTSLHERESQILVFQENLKELKQQILILEEEKTRIFQQLDETTKDFSDYKFFSEEQLHQKNLQLEEFQMTVEQQQAAIDKKQEHVQQLESKIKDLSYEIKTLLYLQEPKSSTENRKGSLSYFENQPSSPVQTEIQPTPPTAVQPIENADHYIKTPVEASHLLKHCIDIAQKLSGTSYYGNESSRYWEMATPRYAIDQRRLFESLRHEEAGLILLYSTRDNRILFANNASRAFLGWNPEKFVQDFHLIIQEGLPEWKKSIVLANSSPETQTRLLIKSRQGQEVLMHCHLGNIPTGVFKNHVIAVLYPT